MKNKVLLDQIKVGSCFSKDVYSDSSNLFVPAGVKVRQKDIDGLKMWNIEYVYTDGVVVDDDSKPKNANIEPESNSQTNSTFSLAAVTNKQIYDLYVDFISRLKNVMDSIAVNETVDRTMIDTIATDLIKVLSTNKTDLISIVLSSNLKNYSYARTGIDTAIFSLIVGEALKLPNYRLIYLACGAMLHDVGMLRIPSEILEKKELLTANEVNKIRSHTLLSYKIIVKELKYPEDVGVLGLQHHERWDGDGYPRKMKGPETDILARIVSVADAFEAMISEKPYRDSMIGYVAIKNLLSNNARHFDPDVLKCFVKSMGIYPIGSIVVLNNAAIARVVDVSALVPLRPKIRIIVDEFGNQFSDDKGDLIDLLAEKTLFIARALDPKDLTK